MNSVSLHTLEKDLQELLEPTPASDYCPNGLQVEGVGEIRRIVTGVTASLDLIELAIEKKADAIMVHHGLMWKGDPQVVRGFRKKRLEKVLAAGLNVFAYHLPLDRHPQLGNNVQLGQILGWPSDRVVGSKGLVHVGQLPAPVEVDILIQSIEDKLGAPCQLEGNLDRLRRVKTVAWCTGGAPGYVEEAALADADVYLTGELSEPAVHVARELGVSLLGAGHHATERCGVKALGEWVASKYGIEVEFHDLFVSV